MQVCWFRCMGRLVRFIHQRDLATENVTRAYVRQSLLLSAPAKEIVGLVEAMREGTLQLENTSLLRPPDEILQSKGGRAGSYDVRVVRSTRKDVTVTEPSAALSAGVRDVLTKYGLGQPVLSSITLLGCAVHINGRPYSCGDMFEYVAHIERRAAARDLSRVSSDRNRHLGRIVAFFLVPTTSENEEVIVQFLEVPVITYYFECPRLLRPPEVNPPPDDLPTHYMHVDSITFKLKIVPNLEKDGEYMALRIWEAR